MRDTPGSTVGGHAAVAYALAALAVAVATAFRLSLDPVLGTQFPFAPFYLLVCVGIVYLGSRTRLRAEALAAQASKDAEKLRVTLRSIGDGVIVTDDRGQVTSMNAVAQSLTGVAAADAVKVVTVSRRPEGNLEAAGAVHVVTAEDVRRTGASSIPDALRTAPGLQASRIDGDEWALAIRGFASRLSRSVLALVDGRSVWTPLFAGVFWDGQDTLLEDIEQIEVSRGPGGAVCLA